MLWEVLRDLKEVCVGLCGPLVVQAHGACSCLNETGLQKVLCAYRFFGATAAYAALA